MKKAGLVFAVALVLFAIAPVIAQTEAVDGAYQCLENQVSSKDASALSLQEAVFSTLALGSDSKLQDRIEDHRSSGEACYGPGSTCTILDTSQVLLAYDRIHGDVEEIKDWLDDRQFRASGLDWFMVIDITNHEEATCEIAHQGVIDEIAVNEDLTLSGNPGGCFTISSNGFWLEVEDTCLEENFEVSCSEDFVTTTLYRKEGGGTVFVSPDTQSSVALGTTEESVNATCFGSSNQCDYEGTLWATLALHASGDDVSKSLPYLLALADDNEHLFPESFLYAVTQGQDQFDEVTQSLKQGSYWEAPATKYNRFYDSALAMLALQGSLAGELEQSRSYFLQIQTSEGCWNNNNIRDTAFLLYGGWPLSDIPINPTPDEDCLDSGFFCGNPFDCIEAGGVVREGYQCTNNLLECCTVPLTLPSCELNLGGQVCVGETQCSGAVEQSADGTCCLGECVPIPGQTACEDLGGRCAAACGSEEEQTTDSCGLNSGLSCCMGVEDEGGSGLWILVIILLILILLVIAAIVYRHKLQLWWYRLQAKWKSKKSRPQFRGGPGGRGPPPGRGPPRGGPPPQPRKMPGRGTVKKQGRPARKRRDDEMADNELDDTLKKLREMSE